MLDAAVAEAEVEVPDKLVHARAHELLEDTMSTRSRARASRKEAYLQIAGKEEETLAHEAEPEAAAALKREAVLAAIVEAENIEPTDEQLLRGARAVGRARRARPPRSCSSSCSTGGRLDAAARGRRDRARRSSCSWPRQSRSASSRRKAREKLWTPGKDEPPTGGAGLRPALDARQLTR